MRSDYKGAAFVFYVSSSIASLFKTRKWKIVSNPYKITKHLIV